MLAYDNNLDDYGFYEVGYSRYYNKIQAILEGQRWNLPVRWNYLDHDYDQHDWTREPNESLPELYAARARDLRERYDYLVLHFSGGSDSANILETFVDNGIHLDEVLIRGSYDQTDRIRSGIVSAQNNYSECLVQSLPLAEWVRDNHMPHLRITVVETTNLILDYFANTPDWAEHSSGMLSPNAAVKGTLDSLAPHYRTLAEQGRRVAHIYGAEKPTIYRHRDQFYTRWLDSVVMNFSMFRTTDSEKPQFVELFYYGRHAIALQIKQLHVLKNYIKQHQVPDTEFDVQRALATGANQLQVSKDINNWKIGRAHV